MPGVFISYRREDSSGYSGRLYDILSAEFGRDNTFMDLDTIEAGDDFASVINQKISVSDVLVAMIGERWLTVEEQGTRRLDNPRDFVRLEIAEALQRGIRVIPVLVAGAALPQAQDLPENLRALCGRQAVELHDSHFHEDAQQLIEVLRSTLHGVGLHAVKSDVQRFAPALVVVAVMIAGAGLLLFHQRGPAAPPLTNPVHPSSTTPAAPPVSSVDAPRDSGNVAGKWHATVKYDWGDTYQETFDFQLDGPKLSGTAGLLGRPRTIQDGKKTGNRISFITETLSALGSDQYQDTHSYDGALEGDTIRFTMLTDSRAAEHPPLHFIATKVKDK